MDFICILKYVNKFYLHLFYFQEQNFNQKDGHKQLVLSLKFSTACRNSRIYEPHSRDKGGLGPRKSNLEETRSSQSKVQSRTKIHFIVCYWSRRRFINVPAPSRNENFLAL